MYLHRYYVGVPEGTDPDDVIQDAARGPRLVCKRWGRPVIRMVMGSTAQYYEPPDFPKSFTAAVATRYWRGRPKQCVVFEFASSLPHFPCHDALIQYWRAAWGQDSVLWVRLAGLANFEL